MLCPVCGMCKPAFTVITTVMTMNALDASLHIYSQDDWKAGMGNGMETGMVHGTRQCPYTLRILCHKSLHAYLI